MKVTTEHYQLNKQMIHTKNSHKEIQVKGHAQFNLLKQDTHATIRAVRGSGASPTSLYMG